VQLQDITKILDLQGVSVTKIDVDAPGEVRIWLKPTNYKQKCPCCASRQTIRNGKDGYRQIRHLPMCDKICILIVPKIRLKCKSCEATFAYTYDFVAGKQRYTKAFKAFIYELSIGSTVQHTAEITKTPYSTAEQFFKEIVQSLAPVTEAYAQKRAQKSAKLILGIDDFAIRKGHNYNTGIHDLRGESLLCVIEGRTLPELKAYMSKNPQIAALDPFAIVMDLARGYHSFSAEYFPNAIRVADRFHVNKYIIEALNEVRRRVGKNLAPKARLSLNRHKHLLNKRKDTLSQEQHKQLKSLLGFSDDLKAVYNLKEQLADWYDCSPNYPSASASFQLWLKKGRDLGIPEVIDALKTFQNWQPEILNYHLCRFTNGIVEGRNGKIKSLQRRRFFAQNRTYYESLIILECNKEISQLQFSLFVS